MFNLQHKPAPKFADNRANKLNPPAATSTHERSGASSTADEAQELIAGFGPGRPLQSRSRTLFERAYGASLSHVELHVDDAAHTAADRMSARAFTYGSHIGFARGEYRPGSLEGDLLLAHELAHVQQQRDASTRASASREGSLERDANQAAVGSVLGLSSARPQAKSGLRLSRCTCGAEGEQKTEQKEDLQEQIISDSVNAATEHVPGLGQRFRDKMISPSLEDMHGKNLAKVGRYANDGSYRIDPQFFEEQFKAQSGELLNLSDPLRGIVLLHEMLHFTHPGNASDLIAEGQGWGLEVAFLENLKESDAWDKLSKDQQETIDKRIRDFLGEPNQVQQKNVRRTAVLFKILLHRARGFDLPKAALEQVGAMTAEEAQRAITQLVDVGFDFDGEKSLEGYDKHVRQLLQWIGPMDRAELDNLYNELTWLGPKVKQARAEQAAKQAERAAEAEQLNKRHEEFIGQQAAGWHDADKAFLTAITRWQSAEFYDYFAPSESRKKAKRLRPGKKLDKGVIFEFKKANGDMFYSAGFLEFLHSKGFEEQTRGYLAAAFQRYADGKYAPMKFTQSDMAEPQE